MVSLLEASTLRKPHIRLKWGVWGCRSGTCLADMVIGFGYTPKAAYEDWRRQHA